MGQTYSYDAFIFGGSFDKVGDMTIWKVGLTLGVIGQEPLQVHEIKPAREPRQKITRELVAGESMLVYYYEGKNINVDLADFAAGYLIYLRKLVGKVGGSNPENLMDFDEAAVDEISGINENNGEISENSEINGEINGETSEINLKTKKGKKGKIDEDNDEDNDGSNDEISESSEISKISKISEDLTDNADLAKHTNHTDKNIFRSADGFAPNILNLKYPETHPDDVVDNLE